MDANKDSYNSFLASLGVDRLNQLVAEKKEVARINTDEFVFSNVYESARRNIRLPATNFNYTLFSSQSAGKEVILTYRDGTPYLQKFTTEKGNVYLCSAAMNEEVNDLVRNAEVFVPMLYKMALSSGARASLSYTIGEDDVVALSSLSGATAERYQMAGPTEFIPAVTTTGQIGYLDVRDQISSAGYYDLKLEDEVIESLSFNYNRQESDVQYGDISRVASNISSTAEVLSEVALADLSGYISERNDGVRLWRWCLILALLFLLLEIGLIRLWK